MFCVVLVSALAALAGCGDDSSGASGGGGSSSSTSASSGGGGPGGGGGAGGAPDTDDTYESGTRLRAIVVDGGGEARMFEGWFDAEIGVECDMRRQPGDEWRCLPSGAAEVGYLDAACTQPVAVPYGECALTDGYITQQIPATAACNADDSLSHVVYRVLGDAGSLAAYHRLGPNGCAPATIPTKPVKLLEPVPVESFVEFERSLVPIDDEVGRWVYASADGASIALGTQDLGREGFCSLMEPPPADGALVCIPSAHRRYPNFAYWADGSCGTPVATISACSDLTAPIVDFEFTGSCGETYGVLRESGAVVPPPLHESFGQAATCLLQTGISGLEAGAPIPLDGFPSLEKRARQGVEVELVRTARGGTDLSSYGQFRLSSTGDLCRPRLTGDGSWRCVPQGTIDSSFGRFADANCTVPLAYKGRGDLSCGEESFVGIGDDDPCIEEIYELYELGATHDGPVFRLLNGVCTAVDVGDSVYASIGEQVDFETLPLIEVHVE